MHLNRPAQMEGANGLDAACNANILMKKLRSVKRLLQILNILIPHKIHKKITTDEKAFA